MSPTPASSAPTAAWLPSRPYCLAAADRPRPVVRYRARLGFLFGSRLIMLEHTGRKTGARRPVILEIVGHPPPATYIVAAGFGQRPGQPGAG
jgi:hypothetical protein